MKFVIECEEWVGEKNAGGYGKKRNPSGGSRLAHRQAYEREYGEIGPGRNIHHLCNNPPCVTPDHLISVTQAQHISLFGAKQPKKRFCIHGHDTLVLGRTKRGTCRKCKNLSQMRSKL